MAEPKRYALIRDGKVENVCLWDGDPKTWTPPAGATMIESATADPGDLHDAQAGTFTKLPPVPPPKSELEQLRDALLEKGVVTPADLDRSR